MALTPEDFLLEDYKQKIGYLTQHFGRMWTRFNFFVSLETALLGGKLLLVGDKPSPIIGLAGITLSLIWYVMGAEDRFLADFYRWQVYEAAGRIKDALAMIFSAESKPPDEKKSQQVNLTALAQTASNEYVGRVDDDLEQLYHEWKKKKIKGPVHQRLEQISTWRSESFSTTHLAAWIPLITCVAWAVFFVAQLGII